MTSATMDLPAEVLNDFRAQVSSLAGRALDVLPAGMTIVDFVLSSMADDDTVSSAVLARSLCGHQAHGQVGQVGRPLDERLAAMGLSPKLHAWQIPEIAAAGGCMEELMALEEGRDVQTRPLPLP